MPFPLALRLWDTFILEGAQVLSTMGYVVLKLNQSKCSGLGGQSARGEELGSPGDAQGTGLWVGMRRPGKPWYVGRALRMPLGYPHQSSTVHRGPSAGSFPSSVALPSPFHAWLVTHGFPGQQLAAISAGTGLGAAVAACPSLWTLPV